MSFLDIVKSILPLIIIAGLLFGVLLLVRKYSFSITGKKLRNLKVDVLHNQLILPKKYLSFVRIEDKILVLGISENNISVLQELNYNEFEESNTEFQKTKLSFIDILKQNMGM